LKGHQKCTSFLLTSLLQFDVFRQHQGEGTLAGTLGLY